MTMIRVGFGTNAVGVGSMLLVWSESLAFLVLYA